MYWEKRKEGKEERYESKGKVMTGNGSNVLQQVGHAQIIIEEIKNAKIYVYISVLERNWAVSISFTMDKFSDPSTPSLSIFPRENAPCTGRHGPACSLPDDLQNNSDDIRSDLDIHQRDNA